MYFAPRSDELRKRRVALGLTLEKLAEKACLSVGAVRRAERGERTRGETIDALADALGVPRDEVAQLEAHAGAEPPPPRRQEPAVKAIPTRAEDLAPRSRLTTLAGIEDKLPRQPGALHGGQEIPPLTARELRGVYTSFGRRVARQYAVRGKVIDQRGLSPEEAAQLGTSTGMGARFQVVRPIDAEWTLGVTVHATEAGVTDALLDIHESVDVCLVARVVASTGHTPVFASFSTPNLLPWALLVDAIVDEAKPRPARGRR